jgi:hypothetical protein
VDQDMSAPGKPEITIDIHGDNVIPKREDFRYMFVLFTLERRAYSVGEVFEIADQMKAEGVAADDIHCIKIDCGDDLEIPVFPFLGSDD